MKILCWGDAHIGVTTYGRIDPTTNLNTRILKALESMDEMIDYAINKKIKVMIFAGDMYKNSSVSSTISAEVNKRMRRALDADIQIFVLDGNHDVDKIETKKSPLNVFSDLKIPNIIQTREHKEVVYELDGEKVKFVFLPTYHTLEDIEGIVKSTTYDGFPIVYIFHGTLRGANLNDWNIAENELYIDAEVFEKEGVAAVVSGHLHKHQTLYNQPLVFYTGSLQRVDFSEENQPKGFVVLNVNEDSTATYDFIELESQKFLTIDVNLINESNETDLIIEELDKFHHEVKDAIVRIRVELDKSNTFNETRIYEYAYKLGAQNVLDIQKKFEKRDIVRNIELTEHVDEYKALRLYCKDKHNEDALVRLGEEIIEAAKLEGKI